LQVIAHLLSKCQAIWKDFEVAEIVVIGEILVEMVAAEIGQGFLVPGRFDGPFPSGAPAIFADQAAKQGISVALAGCVGQDDFGAGTLQRLARDGVDISAVRCVPGLATGVAFVAYASDGGRQFIFHMANAAASQIRVDQIAPALFRGCKFLHVMGSSLFSDGMAAAIRAGVVQARAAGARISFDPNIRPELLAFPATARLIQELLDSANVPLPSEADLAHLFPGADTDSAARALLDRGADCVFLKRGAKGSTYYDRQNRIETPAFAVAEIDPTGAGDCAGATFIAGMLRGLPLQAVLQRANAAGALAVTARGPMEGNSTATELDAFMRRASA
jgi:fructokinase